MRAATHRGRRFVERWAPAKLTAPWPPFEHGARGMKVRSSMPIDRVSLPPRPTKSDRRSYWADS